LGIICVSFAKTDLAVTRSTKWLLRYRENIRSFGVAMVHAT